MRQVINTVGASSLRATLNCEEFATAHSSTAHYDSKSFVGLAWRPAGESICCGESALCTDCHTCNRSPSCARVCCAEIYSTGEKQARLCVVWFTSASNCDSCCATGRSNLPGSVVERQLQESFSRMLPQLLKYSSASRLVSLFPKELQEAHEVCVVNTKHVLPVNTVSNSMWDGWADASKAVEPGFKEWGSSDEDGLDLTEIGL